MRASCEQVSFMGSNEETTARLREGDGNATSRLPDATGNGNGWGASRFSTFSTSPGSTEIGRDEINHWKNSRSRACGNCGKSTTSLSGQDICGISPVEKPVEKPVENRRSLLGPREKSLSFHNSQPDFPQVFPQVFPQPAQGLSWGVFLTNGCPGSEAPS